ncbi:kynurenine--oxoglutarate transaminase 1-like [Microcaecilia unicolor]|uniref:Kynurenine--oxoglutarate transaminase 1-like n=1 Tax=Microcaecilia unicolor TaxID=1415580 RepID=A0A6P7YL67_9AMPH|nr:kynurenine--oxoglutarate transaminase 1-like [Microcaecilia unicolor]
MLSCQEAVSYMFKRELSLFGTPDSYFVQLPQELKQKRNRLAQCLTEVGMEPIIPEGSYYMMADISRFKASVPPSKDADEPFDHHFVKWMMKHKRLAAIPVSAFYSTPHKKMFEHFIRFCFVKENKTLEAAEEILQRWSCQQPTSP